MEQRVVQSSSAPVAAGNNRPLPGLAVGLSLFKQWANGIAQAVAEYQAWVEHQEPTDGERDLRLYELLDGLKSDKIVIALVGEFARGKTELLNALFFSEFKQRLLPAAAGRTTMCPTELRYDDSEPACIKLLPIETRKTALTISDYRRTPVHWTTVHLLKPNSIEEMRQAFSEVTRTKQVHAQEAKELGLPLPDNHNARGDSLVEIPVWRHAIINFPHPLLQQGLVILDTPGLNAIGTEPELTLKTLPAAHGLLFLLAADAGVSRTDLDIWRHCVRGSRADGHSRLVVLNKIDILWDALREDNAIEATVRQQVRQVAHDFELPEQNIFALSAQKALAAKIKSDGPLLRRSGVFALEQRLAHDILPAKHQLIRARFVNEVGARLDSSRAIVQTRLTQIEQELQALKHLGSRNTDAVKKMVAQVEAEKQRYERELEGFELTRAALTQQARALLEPLSLASVDTLIDQSRSVMQDSWTTRGLKSGMATFFRGAEQRMHDVAQCAATIKRDVRTLYDRLQSEYGFAPLVAPEIPLMPYVQEFERLAARAEAFRNSPVTLVTEQRFIIRRFFDSLVARARYLFEQSNKGAKAWFQALVTPAYTQLHHHRQRIDARLEMLAKIHQNADRLSEQIATLESTRRDLAQQLALLDRLRERLTKPAF